MAKMPQEAQDLFNAVHAVTLGTASATAQPNISIVAMKKVVDDETLYLSDQFFKKTLANCQENQKVCITWWGEGGAYQVYGTARYVNEGAEFEEQAAWVNAAFQQMGMPITAKGGIFVTVDEVYSSNPGPEAGNKIA